MTLPPTAEATTAPRERGILFSGPMVRAILVGRKTETRRVVTPRPTWVESHDEPVDAVTGQEMTLHVPAGWSWRSLYAARPGEFAEALAWRCRYGRPGDRLWVREAWAEHVVERPGPTGGQPADVRAGTVYRADREITGIRWRPGMFMARGLSRLLLEITAIRAERLQEICEEDAEAEGFVGFGSGKSHVSATEFFVGEWNHLNRKRGFDWDTDPWVWVISFQRLP